jgi:hypothetical protein
MTSALPHELWHKIFLNIAEWQIRSGEYIAPGLSLFSLLLVCREWEVYFPPHIHMFESDILLLVQQIARPVVYSTVGIHSLNAQRRLAALFRHDSRNAWTAVGPWITALVNTVFADTEEQANLFWESIIAILINTPNLKKLFMRSTGIRPSFLDPLLRNNRAHMTHLAVKIVPAHIEVLPLINQFSVLKELDLYFSEKEESFAVLSMNDDALPLLCLPSVRKFVFTENFSRSNNGGTRAVLQYISRSQFEESCHLVITVDISAESFLLLNPLFEAHASTRIEVELEVTDIPPGSSILSNAQRVNINHVPSPELFKTATLPRMIQVSVVGEELLWNTLETLIASPYDHHTQLKIIALVPKGFYWTPARVNATENSGSAHFTGGLMRYVVPLLRKGIEIVDENGRGFRDCFGAILV